MIKRVFFCILEVAFRDILQMPFHIISEDHCFTKKFSNFSFLFYTMDRGCLRSSHLASPRCTEGSHTSLRRLWSLWTTWQSHFMKIWITRLFQMFKNVHKPVEAKGGNFQKLVIYLFLFKPNKTRDSLSSFQYAGQKRWNCDVSSRT
jgi:hypothetical protein